VAEQVKEKEDSDIDLEKVEAEIRVGSIRGSSLVGGSSEDSPLGPAASWIYWTCRNRCLDGVAVLKVSAGWSETFR